MKAKVAIIILILVSLGLGTALLIYHRKSVEVRQENERDIADLSKKWEDTQGSLDEQIQTNSVLSTNVALLRDEREDLSNQLTKVSANLAKSQQEAKAAAEAAAAEMKKRDEQIADLTGQRQQLNKKMNDLNASIEQLNQEITTTEQKLAKSEGDRAFLLKELKRLQAEKAELERQFADLSQLREQVRRLKDELSVAQRLEWIRRGIYGVQNMRQAEELLKPETTPLTRTNFDLNVELKQDGSATIQPPATNGIAPPQ